MNHQFKGMIGARTDRSPLPPSEGRPEIVLGHTCLRPLEPIRMFKLQSTCFAA